MAVVVRSAINDLDSSRVLLCQHRLSQWSIMPQINMISHPVTLNWYWANQPLL